MLHNNNVTQLHVSYTNSTTGYQIVRLKGVVCYIIEHTVSA